MRTALLQLIAAQCSAAVIRLSACKAASSTLMCATLVLSACLDAASRMSAPTSLIATRSAKVMHIAPTILLRAARRVTAPITLSVKVTRSLEIPACNRLSV